MIVSEDLLKKIILELKDGNNENAIRLSKNAPIIANVNTEEWEFGKNNILTLQDLFCTLQNVGETNAK